MTSIREQIEALRLSDPRVRGPIQAAADSAWESALDAVLAVVSPVCPECGGSKEVKTGRLYDQDILSPCPNPIHTESCQGDREARIDIDKIARALALEDHIDHSRFPYDPPRDYAVGHREWAVRVLDVADRSSDGHD